MKRPCPESPLGSSRPKMYQFRAAGPMLLRNPTQQELQHLRSVTSVPSPKVRHLIMSFLPNTRTPILQVFAYAMEKQTAAAWKSILGHRMENVAPPPKSVVHSVQICRGFRYNEITRQYTPEVLSEEFGTPSRCLHLDLLPTPTCKAPKPAPCSSRCVPQPLPPRTVPIQSAVASQAFAMAMLDHAFLAQLDHHAASDHDY